MAREKSAKLHSDSMDADPESEYDEFRDFEDAMRAQGYSKAYIEINPDSYNIDKILGELQEIFMGYSVQIFVRDKGRSAMILVVARKSDHKIESQMKDNLNRYIRDNYIHQGMVDSRSLEPRDFS